MSGAGLVIVAAGLGPKPSMTNMDLLSKNSGIIASVAKQMAKYAPQSTFLMVTNPMDVMTYDALNTTEFPKVRVVG